MKLSETAAWGRERGKEREREIETGENRGARIGYEQ
jgi:hypothetical protein